MSRISHDAGWPMVFSRSGIAGRFEVHPYDTFIEKYGLLGGIFHYDGGN